ncbi:hypothetical protein LNKW23_08110 [Paralimibaculum aggregatum]|uniref:Type VI secretion system lipoprotein TssJ n=1 Tax=Paralimibaculum aggregatum TaxID=3036245 RepID=A0ABQ6LK34_9RHOB|nr:type VI secretion system lipoprotein TssJ [Limibaculum sp. NKW23]GMG81598.1 hypothetical protein LNKW23_08110 [Limibaculum sp. NKW23]
MLSARPLSLIGFGLVLALAGCAEPPPPPQPTTVALKITGGPAMNGGVPAKVKVYYLTADANFKAQDFFALYDNGPATLGADLVTVDEYLLAPGQSVEDTKTFDRAVPHIGAVVGLRNIDQPGWRATGDLAPRAPNAVALTIDGGGAKFGAGGGGGADPLAKAAGDVAGAAVEAGAGAAAGGADAALGAAQEAAAGAATEAATGAATGAATDAASSITSAFGG